jgi:hypothetical protein
MQNFGRLLTGFVYRPVLAISTRAILNGSEAKAGLEGGGSNCVAPDDMSAPALAPASAGRFPASCHAPGGAARLPNGQAGGGASDHGWEA